MDLMLSWLPAIYCALHYSKDLDHIVAADLEVFQHGIHHLRCLLTRLLARGNAAEMTLTWPTLSSAPMLQYSIPVDDRCTANHFLSHRQNIPLLQCL